MALALLIIFLLLAVIGRVALQYKLTGDHGIRPSNSQSTAAAKVTSILLLGAFAGITFLAIIDALQLYILNKNIYSEYLGVVVGIFGIGLTILSQYQMGKSWRIGVNETESTKLIKHGLYSRIRNPIYSGVLVFCIGLLLIMPNIYMLFCFLAVAASIEAHVRLVEEPYLRDKHGSNFVEYSKATGRYWPKLQRRADSP